jgi:hypothetical protein
MTTFPTTPVIPSQAVPTQPVRRPLWVDPPDNWQNIDQLGYVALPAIGAQANIIQFQVPAGYNGVIRKIANNYVGGGWIEGSGSVVWQILVDGAPPPGANSYSAIVGSLGSPANPVEISGFRIFENQVITVVVENVSLVAAGQLAGARLIGWLYPIDEEDDSTFV